MVRIESVKILAAGEQGLVVEFGDVIDKKINFHVHKLVKRLEAIKDDRIIEIIPTYRSLLIYFDPLRLDRNSLGQLVKDNIPSDGDDAGGENTQKVVYVPVCYGGDCGPDIGDVATHNKISVEEVIDIHTSTPYLVYMLGFTPGFPYLGGMSEKIATPRLEQPRTRIPAGSVGIAGSQTGFYPIESPGGWRLIGRTPICAFNSKADHPFLFAAGDYLQFRAISEKEYNLILDDVNKDVYVPESAILNTVGEPK